MIRLQSWQQQAPAVLIIIIYSVPCTGLIRNWNEQAPVQHSSRLFRSCALNNYNLPNLHTWNCVFLELRWAVGHIMDRQNRFIYHFKFPWLPVCPSPLSSGFLPLFHQLILLNYLPASLPTFILSSWSQKQMLNKCLYHQVLLVQWDDMRTH